MGWGEDRWIDGIAPYVRQGMRDETKASWKMTSYSPPPSPLSLCRERAISNCSIKLKLCPSQMGETRERGAFTEVQRPRRPARVHPVWLCSRWGRRSFTATRRLALPLPPMSTAHAGWKNAEDPFADLIFEITHSVPMAQMRLRGEAVAIGQLYQYEVRH